MPTLRIKEHVVTCELPPAKGEGVRRATFPKALAVPVIAMPAFAKYLNFTKPKVTKPKGKEPKGNDVESEHLRNVARLLSFLEADWGSGWVSIDSTTAAIDVKVMCALIVDEFYEQVLELQILDLKYTWAEDILEALIVFVKWHMHVIAERIVTGDEGPLKQYDAVLKLLLERLTGGYRKRLAIARDRKLAAKQIEDTNRIKRLPPNEVRRAAVEKAYYILHTLEKMYGDTQEPLPKETRAMANACLSGAIWLDTFGGRKAEWEAMLAAHVAEMLQQGHDYLLCPEHKTSRTYGTMAKWLSPGLRCAVACYLRLPRPADVEAFLVPATSTTAQVDVPSAFRTFCSHLLPKDHTTPTVNLMRKVFHKSLITLTKDEESLKSIMTRLDGHSSRTIDRHYGLREPEDDVALAKELVLAVLGRTAESKTRHSCTASIRNFGR